MAKYDWSRFSLKIVINVEPRKVYDFFATQKDFESWFLRKAVFTRADGTRREPASLIEPDDTYEWMWHGHPDETVEVGKVTEANGKDMFQFIFGRAGLVTFQLTEVGGNTEMAITQEHIPTDEDGKVNYHIGCSTGWTFYLANIKSILEGGLDLRNKNMEIKGVINS